MPTHTESPKWQPHTATGAGRQVRSPGDDFYLCPDPFPEMAPRGGKIEEERWIPSCHKEAALLDPTGDARRNQVLPTLAGVWIVPGLLLGEPPGVLTITGTLMDEVSRHGVWIERDLRCGPFCQGDRDVLWDGKSCVSAKAAHVDGFGTESVLEPASEEPGTQA